MAKHKVTFLDKFFMDGGRVVLSSLIPVFRVKKIYLNGEDTKKKIKNLKGAIIAANHSGFSDPLILNAAFWFRRFFYTAGETLLTGVKGVLLQKAGCIKIDRTKADVKAINRCADVLKEGYLIGMFPQGTIAGGAAKGGMTIIAAMAKVPIVPCYIRKRKHFWQRQVVVFGEPFLVSDFSQKALPGKKDIEVLLNVFDERSRQCQTCIEQIEGTACQNINCI